MEETKRTFTLTVTLKSSDVDLTEISALEVFIYSLELFSDLIPDEPVPAGEMSADLRNTNGANLNAALKWGVDPPDKEPELDPFDVALINLMRDIDAEAEADT